MNKYERYINAQVVARKNTTNTLNRIHTRSQTASNVGEFITDDTETMKMLTFYKQQDNSDSTACANTITALEIPNKADMVAASVFN